MPRTEKQVVRDRNNVKQVTKYDGHSINFRYISTYSVTPKIEEFAHVDYIKERKRVAKNKKHMAVTQ